MGLTFRLGQIPLGVFTDTSNNVGIGAAPSGSYKFEVTGTAVIRNDGAAFQLLSSSTSAQYQKWSNGGGNYYIGISNSGGGGLLGSQNNYSFCLVTESARDMSFGTNSLPRMTIFAGGSVGINTGSNDAGYQLDVNGTGRFSDNVLINNSASLSKLSIKGSGSTTGLDLYVFGANATLSNQDNGSLAFETNGTTRLTIASTGAASFSSSVQTLNISTGSSAPFSNVGVSIRGTITGNNDSWGVYQGGVTLAPVTGNNAIGYQAGGTIATSTSNTVANYYAYYTDTLSKTGTGTITNTYGLYINAQTVGTNNYSAYFAQNVGIGTSSPDGKLDIAQGMSDGSTSAFTSPHLALTATASTNFTGFVGMTFATSDSANYGFSYGALRSEAGAGDLVWRNHFNSAQGTELMRLKNNGNVGIGIASPLTIISTAKVLQVDGSAYGVILASSGSVIAQMIGDAGGVSAFGSRSNHPAIFTTNDTERMRITSGGNVGINEAAPNARLDIVGPSNAPNTYGTLLFRNTSATGIAFGASGTSYTWMQGNVFGSGTQMIAINPQGSNVSIGTTTDFGYKLNLNGQPGANGYTAWTNWSDSRLKENVIDLDATNVLDKISKIRPVTYNYNELSGFDEATRSRRISGFIAQELMEVFPDMVGTIKKEDVEYYDTNLSNLTLYLVKAIQEQQKQIEELKQTVATINK